MENFGYRIESSYREGIRDGRYDNVPYINGGSYPAYARTNEFEYFAEISEAFYSGEFGGMRYQNDLYPFSRDDLRVFDRNGYNLLVDIWDVEGMMLLKMAKNADGQF